MYMYVPMMVAAAADVASHSSEIRDLSSTKCSSETLQNLLYFMYRIFTINSRIRNKGLLLIKVGKC